MQALFCPCMIRGRFPGEIARDTCGTAAGRICLRDLMNTGYYGSIRHAFLTRFVFRLVSIGGVVPTGVSTDSIPDRIDSFMSFDSPRLIIWLTFNAFFLGIP